MKILKLMLMNTFCVLQSFIPDSMKKPLLHHICNCCIYKTFLHYSQRMRLIVTALPSYYLLGIWGHFNLGVGFSEIPLCECYHSGNMLTQTCRWITARTRWLIQEICYTRKCSGSNNLSIITIHKIGRASCRERV